MNITDTISSLARDARAKGGGARHLTTRRGRYVVGGGSVDHGTPRREPSRRDNHAHPSDSRHHSRYHRLMALETA